MFLDHIVKFMYNFVIKRKGDFDANNQIKC